MVYYTAQICLNGHIINTASNKYPEYNKAFCSECGQPTINHCSFCNATIQGDYYDSRYNNVFSLQKLPAYCHNCGKPYPWTASNLEAINELIELDEQLQQTDKNTVKEILPNLLVETPKTKVAEAKFKLVMKKAGKATCEAVKEIIVGIASETIKKSLYP